MDLIINTVKLCKRNLNFWNGDITPNVENYVDNAEILNHKKKTKQKIEILHRHNKYMIRALMRGEKYGFRLLITSVTQDAFTHAKNKISTHNLCSETLRI